MQPVPHVAHKMMSPVKVVKLTETLDALVKEGKSRKYVRNEILRLAREFGTSEEAISNAWQRKTFRWIPVGVSVEEAKRAHQEKMRSRLDNMGSKARGAKTRAERKAKERGKSKPQGKLRPDDVAHIRTELGGVSELHRDQEVVRLATELGVSVRTVEKAYDGRSWWWIPKNATPNEARKAHNYETRRKYEGKPQRNFFDGSTPNPPRYTGPYDPHRACINWKVGTGKGDGRKMTLEELVELTHRCDACKSNDELKQVIAEFSNKIGISEFSLARAWKRRSWQWIPRKASLKDAIDADSDHYKILSSWRRPDRDVGYYRKRIADRIARVDGETEVQVPDDQVPNIIDPPKRSMRWKDMMDTPEFRDTVSQQIKSFIQRQPQEEEPQEPEPQEEEPEIDEVEEAIPIETQPTRILVLKRMVRLAREQMAIDAVGREVAAALLDLVEEA